MLIASAEVGATINWNEIAKKIPGRNNKDCRKRYYNEVAGGLKKVYISLPRSHSSEESRPDICLLGPMDGRGRRQAQGICFRMWIIMGHGGTKDGEPQCRSCVVSVQSYHVFANLNLECSKRWHHCLDPNLERRPWTDKEVCLDH
jgi:hypothetical protein